MKKSLAVLIVMSFLLQIFSCILLPFITSHGWCSRCVKGNIVIEPSFTARDSTTFDEMIVIIREKSDYGTYYDHNARLQPDGSYKTESSTFKEMDDCENNCGSESLPDSLKVLISNAKSDQLILVTVFDCSTFSFQNDDIILPAIILK